MRVFTGKTVLAILAVGILSLAFMPSAYANSMTFDLTSNNLGISGSVGQVVITDSGMNQVTVTITMSAGFSLKLQGGDIAFNGPSGLTSGSASGLSATAGMIGFTGLTFQQFFTGKNISQSGTFAFDYANLKGAPKGIGDADTLTFVLTAPGLTASQFTGVAVHFCAASATDCTDTTNTGFASSGPAVPVPEPGTLTLLGTGLVGLAGLVRRGVRR
jgi:PEP-CTERM motif-containing protein